MKRILIIIPAYNEEKSILKTYQEIENYNQKKNTKYDCIVINDGSTDRTEKILKDNKIPHICLPTNLGIGGAVQTGYRYAMYNDYDIAIQYDGDGQHDVAYIKKIIEPIKNDRADFVIGSRFVGDISEFKTTKSRRIGISIISFIIKIVSGKKLFDITSGFRAANKKIINIFAENYPQEYPEPITNAKLLKSKFRVEEVAVNMRERSEGQSSIHTWKNAYYMINVCLAILINSRRYK